MSILKKRSLLILLALVILIAVPMSFAADVDNNATADVIGIDDSSDSIQAVDDSDVLEVDPEGFIEFENTTIEINEGETATINGLLYYYEGAVSYDDVNFNYSYVDYDGNTQSNQVTHHVDYSSDYGMSVDITGLKAREDPYVVTFTPIQDDDWDTYCIYSDGLDPSKTTSVSILVKALAPSYDYETTVSPSSVDYEKGTSSNVTVTAICDDLGDLEADVTEWQVYLNGADTGTKIGVDAMVKEFVFDLATISDMLNDGINTLVFHPNQGTLESWCYFTTFNYNPLTVNVTQAPAPAVEGNASDIQALLDAATTGSIVDLTAYDVYDIAGASFNVATAGITILGNGNTVIKGFGSGNGIFDVTANDVTIQGIKFIDTNPDSVLTYFDDATKNANEVKGWGVRFFGASNGVVDNCTFIDFNHGVRIQKQANDVTVKNCYFTGVTNYLRNDPQVNVEKGTKAVGVMGSQRPTIINNVFNGSMLDAISLASGCGGAQVINNTFIGNSYAIYFGGASTSGTVIKGNKFKNIGHYEGVDAKTGNPVVWDELPVISIQKSAAGIEIINNEFAAIDNNVLVAAEAGNTAHGGLSELGNINVTGNIVTKYTPDVASQSVVLLHILARAGELNPVGDIIVANNTFEGEMKSVEYWDTNWVSNPATWYIKDCDVVIPKGEKPTPVFEITSIADNVISGVLKDSKGGIIDGQSIFYSYGDVNGTTESDENGLFTVVGEAGKTVVISILNDPVFADASTSITLPDTTPIATELTVSAPSSIYAGDSGTLKVTLKAGGVVLANQTVTVSINGANKVLKTNENGVASTTLKYSSADTKYVYVTYIDSTGKYVSAQKNTKVVINKKATTITAPAKTFKVKATKKVAITLKSGGKAVSGKKVTINVGGKNFNAKTNSKGVATITVKLTKAGTFKYTAKFAGDGAYKAISKTGKIVVKK